MVCGHVLKCLVLSRLDFKILQVGCLSEPARFSFKSGFLPFWIPRLMDLTDKDIYVAAV